MKRPLAISAAVCAIAATQSTAQSFIESSDGEFGAFAIQGGSQLSVNFGDKNMRLSFVRRVSTERLLWGALVEAKASDGILNLFDDSLSTIDWSGEAYVGWVLSDPGNTARFVMLNGTFGYGRRREALADTGASVARRMTAVDGLAVQLALSWFGGIDRAAYLVSVAGSYGTRSNYDDLDAIQVCRDLASQGGQTVRSCAPARLAADYEVSRDVALLVDGVLWPWTAVPAALIAYGRYNTARSQGRFVPAFGVLFGKKGSPLSTVGSLALEFGESTRITLRVGVPLGF